MQLDAVLQLCSALLSIRQLALPHIIDISSSWITDWCLEVRKNCTG